jgi:xanthine/uracil permease
MPELLQALNLDGMVTGMIVGWVLAAIVQALPVAEESDSKWYKFFYNFSHAMAANWKHAYKNIRKVKKMQ